MSRRRGVLRTRGTQLALREAQTAATAGYKPTTGTGLGTDAGCLSDVPRSTVINANVDLTVPGDGIENAIINGLVTMRSSDNFVRNCEVRGPTSQPAGSSGSGLIRTSFSGTVRAVISDCELDMQAPQYGYDGIVGHDYTALRTVIRHTDDGFGVFNTAAPTAVAGVLIDGCIAEHLVKFYPDGGGHVDGTHNDAIQIQSGKNGIVRRTILDAQLCPDFGNTSPVGTNVQSGGTQYSPQNRQANAIAQFNVISGGETSGWLFEDVWGYGGMFGFNATDAGLSAFNLGTFQRLKFDHNSYYPAGHAAGATNTYTININNSVACTIDNATCIYEDTSALVTVRRP